MAFMTPAYTNEDFWIVDTTQGTEMVPAFCVTGAGQLPMMLDGDIEGEPELVEDKWFCRLSASGYMDATDWSGPFETEAEARVHIEETWEVDPDTGDEVTGA